MLATTLKGGPVVAERWKREGREVAPGELPVKVVRKRGTKAPAVSEPPAFEEDEVCSSRFHARRPQTPPTHPQYKARPTTMTASPSRHCAFAGSFWPLLIPIALTTPHRPPALFQVLQTVRPGGG